MKVAFIVEDGSGKEDSNSLVSVEYADSYFETRGNEDWSDAEETEKQFALINATDYVMFVWEKELKGARQFDAQALPFPRINTGYATMPDMMKKSVSEYAVRALSGPLMPDITQDAGGRTVTSDMKKLDVLQKQTSYSEYAEIKTRKLYPVPDALIEPLTSSHGSASFLVR